MKFVDLKWNGVGEFPVEYKYNRYSIIWYIHMNWKVWNGEETIHKKLK